MPKPKTVKKLICGSTGIVRSDHPREFLKTFSGTVVTDGYQVYHKLEKEREDLKVAGCWIHAVHLIGFCLPFQWQGLGVFAIYDGSDQCRSSDTVPEKIPGSWSLQNGSVITL